MKRFMLQTRPLFESYTGSNKAKVLKAAVQEWELDRSSQSTAVVTDNARNMEVEVREAGLSLHSGCFAHSLNLASQDDLNVPCISRLLGCVRKVVAYFHCSAIVTTLLTEKQKMREIALHKLIIKQQVPITVSLLSAKVRRNAHQLNTLDTTISLMQRYNDIFDAEEM